jgi:hypothetical protein
MATDQLNELLAPVVAVAQGVPLDGALEARLNTEFPADGDLVTAIAAACQVGIDAGSLCGRGEPELRYGRAVKPDTTCGVFSVDVVDMLDVAGPFHAHPNGEIDLVLPVDAAAAFDGRGEGWVVYPAGSAHYPTVAGGRARVLYLLPGGAIDFSARPPAG